MYVEIVSECFDEIKQRKARLIYLLGKDDTGKTTLTRDVANKFIADGGRVAIIDADIGQSSRLPLTISLLYGDKPFHSFSELILVEQEFIPGYDLVRYLERNTKTIARYAEKAKKDASHTFIDPTGFVENLGVMVKKKEIEAANPDLIIVLERRSELEPILKGLEYPLLKPPVSEEVKKRAETTRRENRNERFKLYFRDSITQEVQAKAPSEWRNRVVALYSSSKLLGLGVVKNKEDDRLFIITPVKSKPERVEFGHIRLDPELGEIRE